MAKNILPFVIVGILILAVFYVIHSNSNVTQPASITATYYDANGNVVQPYNEQIALRNTKSALLNLLQTFGIVSNTNTVSLTASRGVTMRGSSGGCSGDNCYNSFSSSGYGDPSNILGVGDRLWINYDMCYLEYFTFNTNSLPASIQNSSQITSMSFSYQDEKNIFKSSYSTGTSQTLNFKLLNGFSDIGSSPSASLLHTTYDSIKNNPNTLFSDTYYSYSPNGTISNHDISGSLTDTEILKKTTFSLGVTPSICWTNTQAQVKLGDQAGGTLPTLSVTYNTCNPDSCSVLGKTCGNWSDNCGGINYCGSCPSSICNVSGQCQAVTAKYEIDVNNNGNLPYSNVQIAGMSPNFLSSFSNTPVSLGIGATINFTSSPIDITNYIGQTLTATISANNTYTGQLNTFSASRLIP